MGIHDRNSVPRMVDSEFVRPKSVVRVCRGRRGKSFVEEPHQKLLVGYPTPNFFRRIYDRRKVWHAEVWAWVLLKIDHRSVRDREILPPPDREVLSHLRAQN